MIKEEDISEIYNKGLNDAWELAKKITNETFDYREKIFGYGYNSDVFSKFTPQTALEKIKANEIIIGDIVKVIDDSIRIAIVTQIMSRYVNVLFQMAVMKEY